MSANAVRHIPGILSIPPQPRPLCSRLYRTLCVAKPYQFPHTHTTPCLLRRNFASKPQSLRFRKPAKSTPPSPLPRSTPSPPSTPKYVPTQNLVEQTLANKPSPTLLYIAPTSNTYAITCLGVGASGLSYGLYNFYDSYLVPHPGLWWVVPYMMAGVSVFMIGTGVWIGLGARRLVGSLSALPVHAKQGVAGGRVATQNASLTIRLDSKPILPFLSTRTLNLPLSDFRLGGQVVPVAAGLTTYNSSLQARGTRAAAPHETRREIELRQAQENEEKTLWQVLTGPLRTFMSAGRNVIGRVVARDGFVSLYVQGKMWRIDAREGWLLDDGLTLDRLIKTR